VTEKAKSVSSEKKHLNYYIRPFSALAICKYGEEF
jgi:hypothetical protein